MRVDVSLETVSVKIFKVRMVWLLMDFCFSINDCTISSRLFLDNRHKVDKFDNFKNSNVEEMVVRFVYGCHFFSENFGCFSNRSYRYLSMD